MSADAPTPALAIVGIGCLFPKADGLSAFWANIRNGVDAIGPVPPTHWNPEEYFDADPKSPDRTYARRGGFLPPVDFNPLDFGISPNVLEATDATQLLGLVVAQRALRDAGMLGEGKAIDRNRTSVILGVTGTLQLVIPLGARLGHPIWRRALRESGVDPQTAEDVVQRIADGYVPWQENSFPGLLGNVAAGRIANRLDLGGTNCVVDAACASSLSALHLAALELASGRCDAAVTGGFDTFNDIFMYMCFSKTPALSPTGDARPFDAAADGTILGEGLGALVIKRLADARRAGDRIYAVIRSVGSSSDGKGNAIYAPSAAGQAKALRRAYELAGIGPDTIELVEAHGTGTKVGDATEVSALTTVFREARPEGTWCAIGSIKSQIGHTKAAAGVAGLIKAALALHHKVLPPTVKVKQPHGLLAAEGADAPPFYVNTVARPWAPNSRHPRRAAVSSFGFGGSNFHCVLEEADPAPAGVDWDGEVQMASFSGPSPAALGTALDALPADTDWNTIRAFAAASRRAFRPTDPCRLALVLERDRTDLARLTAGVRRLLAEKPGPGSWSTPDGAYFRHGPVPGALAFVFPGQGSQYVGMLRDLACVFPEALEALARADASFPGASRLSERIHPHPAFTEDRKRRQEEELRDTAVAQPAIGAVSLGALRILGRFGVRPGMVAGHSFGELTALCAAGAIDEPDFHRLAGVRGRLMAQGTGDRGSMLAVQGSLDEVAAFLQQERLDLVLANRNAPRQGVLSGASAEIERAQKALESRGMRCRRLPVAAAFHSRFVAEARAPFAETLEQTEFRAPRLPVFANVTGEAYPSAPAAMRTLLADQLAQPVDFVGEIGRMHAAGARTFIEVGPADRLTGLVKAILEGKEHEAFAIDAGSGSRSGLANLARTLAQLAALGYAVDLKPWDEGFAPPNPQKPGLSVTLTGVNYVKPRAPRPPRIAAAPAPAASTPGNGSTRTAPPVPPPQTAPTAPTNGSASRAVPAPAAAPDRPASTSAPAFPVSPAPAAPHVPAPAALSEAVRAAQDGIAALQKMQGQTAELHRKFLEGQEAAQLAVLRMVEHQQALLRHQLESPGSPAHPALPLTPARSTGPVSVAEAAGSAPAPVVPVRPTPVPVPDPVTPRAVPATADDRTRTAPAEPERLAVAARAAGPSTETVRILLEVVAEKTGYPTEMLQIDMGLDSDLGIDSIKRVEILSALQERLPNAPAARPEDLGRFHTLRQIAEFLSPAATAPAAIPPSVGAGTSSPHSDAPARAAQAAAPAGPAADVVRVLLEVVAEKTGYPAEMLQLDMGLDSDLGIDSIKRVEILSALQERLPNAPAARPEDLGRFHTLRQIAEFLSPAADPATTLAPAARDGFGTPAARPESAGSAASPADSIRSGGTADRSWAIVGTESSSTDVVRTLLEVVAEKTGYPAEMLQLDMGLDSDLGIDSIKRVEILSALQERLPKAPAARPEDLRRFHTLRQIAEFLSPPAASPAPADSATDARAGADPRAGQGEIGTVPAPVPAAGSCAQAPPSVARPESTGPAAVPGYRTGPGFAAAGRLDRRVLSPAPLPSSPPRQALEFPRPSVFWIVDGGSPWAAPLAATLRGRGIESVLLAADALEANVPPIVPGSLRALVLMGPGTGSADRFLRQALRWTQVASATLRENARRGGPALLATVTGLDGTFGLAGFALEGDAARGGLAGLAKTAAREWTDVRVKALDLDPSESADPARVETLAGELFLDGPIEVGLSRRGRVVPVLAPLPLSGRNGHPGLAPGELVIVTGGARGVTAEVAHALAGAYRPTLLLLGRSPEPAAEPEWLRPLADEAAIKRALLGRMGAAATPRAIGEEVRRHLSNREILATIERLQAAGATVVYRAVDVRDAESVRAAVDHTRRDHGPVRGLVHGAGVLADRRIEDKTVEQFDEVYGTKVEGARALLQAAGHDDLRFLVLFSSSTGRFGRVGQVDYAMANEALNKIAQAEAVRRPHCRVVSVNWGPWEGGMVTPALARVFAQEGVGLIPLEAGAAHLVGEIALPPGGEVETVVLGPLPGVPDPGPARGASEPTRVALAVDLDVERFPVLRSHVLDGKAVLPVALMVEWMAHAAMHDHPGLAFRGVDDLSVFKGVLLDAREAVPLRLLTGEPETRDGLVRVPVALRSERPRSPAFLHARATVVLGGSLAPEEPALPNAALPAFPLAPAECYASGRLFHGPDLHGIADLVGCDPGGIIARAHAAPVPADWIARPWRGQWIADPLALDVAFQLMILWSQEVQGVGSLPTGFLEFRQFRRSFPRDGVRIVARITSRSTHAAGADLEFLDREGKLVARLRGFRGVLDASLDHAFRRNRLAEEMVSGS